jgi:hypothetical protein
MACPAVPEQDSGQFSINYVHQVTPYTPNWWATDTITNIPSDSVGWLVAQGWQIVTITYDRTTTPPTAYYELTRESLKNWIILQSLLEEYTRASNVANTNNTIRYNDIITSWDIMLETSHDQFEAQSAEHVSYSTLYLANTDTFMNEVDSLIDLNQSQLLLDTDDASDKLTEMHTKLSDLETNVVTSTATIDALLVTQDGYLTTFLADLAAKLADLDTDYAAQLAAIDLLLTQGDADLAIFVSDYEGELANLQSEYTTHSDTATAFLVDLGATDLARINEQFDAALSEQLQLLTDRGLYSSAVAVDVTARNTRDRDEQITALNDRLMREKLENQHSIYGQKVAMRERKLNGVDRLQNLRQSVTQWNTSQRDSLFAQLQQIQAQHLTGIASRNATSQDVSRVEMTERERLLGFLQDSVNGVISGKGTYSQMTVQHGSTLAEHKHRAIAEKVNESVQRLASLQLTHEECLKLMQYQLDERNKILIGLYGFVERRDDVAPNFEMLVQVATGLGDAGGGWVTP